MKVDEDLLEIITIEDLDDRNREIAELIGIDNLFEMCKWYGGGEKIYFNKIDGILKNVRDNRVREEFNGINARELSHKYGVSTVRIRQICKG